MSQAAASAASTAASTSLQALQALQAKRWYFTKEDLSDTPSLRAGLPMERELSYRQQAANFIQDMGQKLQVTQLCINTGIVYVQRFYMFHSFTRFHRNTMAAAALFLAAKIEEQPRKLEHVIKIAHNCLHRNHPPLDSRSEAYQEQAQELVANENILLQTLGFDVAIDHPHTHVVKCCQLVKAPRDLAQSSYFMATNSLHLTTLCLRYSPQVVACVCIHLACKWSKYQIPLSLHGKEWFFYIDQSATADLIEELTKEFLDIFEKSPSRLRNKIENCARATREEEERRARADVSGSQYHLDLGNNHRESNATSTISSASISTGSTSHSSSQDATHSGRHSSASQGQRPSHTSSSKPGTSHGGTHPRSSESLKRASEPLPQDPHKRQRVEQASEPGRRPSEAPKQPPPPPHPQRPSSHQAPAARDHRPPGTSGSHDNNSGQSSRATAHPHHGAAQQHAGHHHKREGGSATGTAAQVASRPHPQPEAFPSAHRHSQQQQQQQQPQLQHSQLLQHMQHMQPPIPNHSQQYQNAMPSQHQLLLASQQQQQQLKQQQPLLHQQQQQQQQQRHQQKSHPPQPHHSTSSLLHAQIPLPGAKYPDPRGVRGPPLPPSQQHPAGGPPLPPPPSLPREEAKPPPPPMPPPASAPQHTSQKRSIFDIDSSSSPLATGLGTDLAALTNMFNSPANLSDVSDLDMRDDAAAAAASVDIDPGEMLDAAGGVQSLQFPFPAMSNSVSEAQRPAQPPVAAAAAAMPKTMLVSIPFSKGKIVGETPPSPSESKHRDKKKKKEKKEKRDKEKKEDKREKEKKKHRHKDKDRERKHDNRSHSSPSLASAVSSPSVSVQAAGLKLRIKTVMPSPGDAQSVAPIKIKTVRPAPEAAMSRVMGTSFETEHIYLEDNVLKNSGKQRKDVG